MHLDYTKVIILILWWRNFQLEYWRTFQLVSTHHAQSKREQTKITNQEKQNDMASLTKAINKDLFDSILPTFGNQRVHIPVWDEGQKMFLCEEYESASGNRYYKGVRFCDRIVVVEKVGLYHNWTYIDGIEVYAFNGTRLELVQKRDYDKVHRNEEFIRKELEIMVRNFFEGVLKAQRSCMPQEELEEKAKGIIDGCYKSFLDSDYNTRLTQILPQIEQK